jgi:hypothetical protein
LSKDKKDTKHQTKNVKKTMHKAECLRLFSELVNHYGFVIATSINSDFSQLKVMVTDVTTTSIEDVKAWVHNLIRAYPSYFAGTIVGYVYDVYQTAFAGRKYFSIFL